MKKIFCALFLLGLSSCTTQGILGFGISINEETKNPDGSYKLVVEGAPNVGGEIITFFDKRAKELCGGKGYEYKEITDKGYKRGNPIYGATFVCEK